MSASTGRRVLVVDDNAAIHEDFRKILGAAGESSALDQMAAELFDSEPPEPRPAACAPYDIDSAYQGEQAFAMVREQAARGERFALAFVDMRMPPGWDGVETIEKIWSVDPEIQCVICTAYSDYPWEDIVKKFGVSDRLLILKKPFDSAEVCQLACALTEKWRLAQQTRRELCRLNDVVEQQARELLAAGRRPEGPSGERPPPGDALGGG